MALSVAPSLVGQGVPAVAARESVEDASLISLDVLLVTGSAVPVSKGQTFQPVSIFEREDFTDLGASTTVEGLRYLPAFFGNAGTEQRSNGGTGAATVNLRGLGGMLALVDGHRTAGFDEVNLVPMIAVQRIEIVKDGTGARYGADALTGVYNSVLVPRFQGTKVTTFYGNTTEDDAGVFSAGIITGAKAGRTDIVVAAEYYERNALMARDREISADADMRSQGGTNRRDGQISTRLIGARFGDSAWNYLALAPGKSAAAVYSDFSILDVNAPTSSAFYNVRETTASIPEQQNRAVYARINHQILDQGRLEAHARLLYSKNWYDSYVLTNAFGITQGQLAANPHRPAGLTLYPVASTEIIGFLHPDSIGARGRRYERQVYDFQAGLNGRLGETWSWDVTYVYGWWYRDDLQRNGLNSAALRASIVSGAYNPYALDSAAGIGPNGGLAYDNPAALRAASASGRIDHDFGTRGVDARVGGNVFDLAAGAVQFAGGADYYRVEQSTVPDAVISSNSFVGFNSTQFSASGYESEGVYGEFVVPIFGDDFRAPGIHSLKLSVSGRFSKKDIEGTVRDGAGSISIRERSFKETTPKVGVIYEPFAGLGFRSTYAEGFRTPALSAQFYAQSSSSLALSDPLGFAIGNTTQIVSQGNPDLESEFSKTWSTGIRYEPKGVKGLRLEADYYWARLENMVSDSAQLILDVNAATQGAGFQRGVAATINPNAMYADRITRNLSGSVTQVRSTPMNLSFREAAGVDYSLAYGWDLAGARWDSRLAANTTLFWDLGTAEGLPSLNWLGRFVDVGVNPNSPGSIPRHRGNFTQKWQHGSWSLVGRANYVSKLEDDRTRTAGGSFRYIESWTTFDAQVGYRWVAGKLDVRLGVTNLADEEAPFAAGAFNDGYDVTTHSNRGRFVYVQVTKAF